ncbi:hypothetical protein ACHQM5_012230 [Ranunculus cassubicifolius]
MVSHHYISSCMIILLIVNFVCSDISKDRDECATQLVGLASCLPYVGGSAKAPTLDCCTGLKQVLANSKKCLCLLVKYRNDPQLGFEMNATLALSLPSTCNAPSHYSDCPTLLHLAPNSTEARDFERLDNSTKVTPPAAPAAPPAAAKGRIPSSSAPTTPTAKDTSDGSQAKSWLGTDMVVGVVVWLFVFNF